MSTRVARRTAVSLLAVTLALAGCGQFLPYSQGGSRAAATQAANAFLTALVTGDSNEAWSHLTPKTKQVVYENDPTVFAADVESADWSRMAWQMGPVTDLDISWGVHAIVDAAAVPVFLVAREIVAGGPDSDMIVLLVQIPGELRDYLIAAQGLDERL